MVSVILDGVSNALSSGRSTEIRDSGSFVLNNDPPRTQHNPKSREAVKVPAKYVPRFRPAKELKKRFDLPVSKLIKTRINIEIGCPMSPRETVPSEVIEVELPTFDHGCSLFLYTQIPEALLMYLG